MSYGTELHADTVLSGYDKSTTNIPEVITHHVAVIYASMVAVQKIIAQDGKGPKMKACLDFSNTFLGKMETIAKAR